MKRSTYPWYVHTMTADLRLDALVIRALYIGHATSAERRNEHRQTRRSAALRRAVCLLLAWIRLKPDDRIRNMRRNERAHEFLHPRLTAP
jgi:hypothetical protein